MNIEEAKRILIRCRPGPPEAGDEEAAEALALARREPELQAWLNEQTALHSKLREAFRQIPVPPGLPDTMLRQARTLPFPGRMAPRQLALALAAAFIGILAILFLVRPAPSETFDVFRGRMVRSVLREYRMDIQTNSMARIREFLAVNAAPADYEISGGLARFDPMGAGLLSWQDRRVSMVCLDGRANGTLFLFIVDRASVQNPPPERPAFSKVNKLTTASWSRGQRSYMLAAAVEEDQLAACLSE